PVWLFITDWFPLYLVAKGISLKSELIAVWIPFIGADLGNFFGGAASGYLIKRGWSLGAARKAVVVFGGIGVTLLIPTIFTTNLYAITVLFGLATFCYASFSTIANVLPSDLYPSEAVATVSGVSGTGAGLATIVAFLLIGHYSDRRQATTTHALIRLSSLPGWSRSSERSWSCSWCGTRTRLIAEWFGGSRSSAIALPSTLDDDRNRSAEQRSGALVQIDRGVRMRAKNRGGRQRTDFAFAARSHRFRLSRIR